VSIGAPQELELNSISESSKEQNQKYVSYNITCRDGKAKTLKIKINNKWIETPLFIPGHSFRGKNGNPYFWEKTVIGPLEFEKIDVSAIMVNAYDLRNLINDTPIHQLLGFEGVVYIDSGGYQYLSKKIIPNPEKIMNIQEKSNADIIVPLDRPIPRKPTEEQIRLSIQDTLKNNLLWQERFGERVLPVIHGTELKHLVNQMEELSEPKIVGIGSLVPQFMYTSRKKTISLISSFTSLYPDIYLHAFGVSYSLSSLLFLIGVDSVDSTSWIHNSRFGSMRLPYQGPRSVALRTKSVSRHKSLTRNEWESFKCSCPICSYQDRDKVWEMLMSWKALGFRTRSIHNVFVNLELANEIKEKICSNSLKSYINEVISKTSLSYLLKDDKLRQEIFQLV